MNIGNIISVYDDVVIDNRDNRLRDVKLILEELVEEGILVDLYETGESDGVLELFNFMAADEEIEHEAKTADSRWHAKRYSYRRIGDDALVIYIPYGPLLTITTVEREAEKLLNDVREEMEQLQEDAEDMV